MGGVPGPPVIAVDAHGADLGVEEVAAGAVLAAAEGVRVLLFGPAATLGGVVVGVTGVELVDAPVSIAKAPDPVRATRSTPEASIVQAARAVSDGRAQALVCGGSTGVALAAGLFEIKRARGVHRPALAVPLPVPGHPVTLLDVGANADCRPEHLVQFALMGAAFARSVLGLERPRVGLLSNGEEAGRGSSLVLETHEALAGRAAESDTLHFVGNVEGDALTGGAADVVVTDGFTGNVALKLMEGVSQTLLGAIRAAAGSSSRGRAGGLLLAPALRGLRTQIDPEEQGGAYLLGLRRLGVVPHGRFTRRGYARAILRAEQGAREDLVGRTHRALEQAGVLRRAPVSADTASVAST
ncbi:MAG TPA: phosphate acyltransferase PlsX [Solirubrobacteraceae bacterium]|jgi:glycerol-3-phosphate acyltransferase PlsX|nr:phosphate acyltransferase PlsX [Solirubrobacteraceae bacterium]